MPEQTVIEARVNGKTFTEFAVFDVLRRQKRWKNPLFFALAFVGFGIIALSQQGKNPQAVLLASVLIGLGLLLPTVYFAGFFLSVRKQAKAQQDADAAYTVVLDEKGFRVSKGEQSIEFAWEPVREVHRLQHCICLYPDAIHAFLLPESCGEERIDAAWKLIAEHVDAGRLKDHR